MKERLLQFIWQHQYFNQQELCIDTGEPLKIVSPGTFNTHQGPDFLNAVVRIGNTCWAGHIELHIAAADWKRHGHEEDEWYRNVILHVVWEPSDASAGSSPVDHSDSPSRYIPTLVLQDRVPKLLLSRYQEWMNNHSFIACEPSFSKASIGSRWKQQLLEERLQRRAAHVQACLQQNQHHWEETTWWLMARNMGLPVNAEAFEAIARSLPVRILAKHRSQPVQLEALLLGQAGLLEQDFTEDYPRQLQQEFRHLQNLYKLPVIHEPVRYLRMRPGNFPAIRLAQLAALLAHPFSWLTRIRETGNPVELGALLRVEASPYWDHHYSLEQPSSFKKKRIGPSMQTSILINTFIPLLFAYGQLHGDAAIQQKARKWLEEIPAEENTLIARWKGLGAGCDHAADSQALLELKTRYCDPRKCLDCAIGRTLLGKSF